MSFVGLHLGHLGDEIILSNGHATTTIHQGVSFTPAPDQQPDEGMGLEISIGDTIHLDASSANNHLDLRYVIGGDGDDHRPIRAIEDSVGRPRFLLRSMARKIPFGKLRAVWENRLPGVRERHSSVGLFS